MATMTVAAPPARQSLSSEHLKFDGRATSTNTNKGTASRNLDCDLTAKITRMEAEMIAFEGDRSGEAPSLTG